MNRKLVCDSVNAAGDEVWDPNGGTPNSNTVCSTVTGLPESHKNITSGGYSVYLTLLADAWVIVKVTDNNGCTATCSTYVNAEDVRCFAADKSTNLQKVTLCHKTGSAKNPIVTICVDQSAVAEHLAHGDCYGNCPKNAMTCTPPQNMYAQTLQNSDSKLSVKIMPNPSVKGTDFTLNATGKTSQDVQIRVLNMLGKTVYSTKGAANQTYKFGGNFISGIYIVEVIQGTEIQRVKVVKQ